MRSLLKLALVLQVAGVLFASSNAFAEIVRFGELEPGLYHGSQPETPQDYAFLKSKGVKTIVNMRWDKYLPTAKADAKKYGFKFVNVQVVAMKGPTDEQMDDIFAAITAPENRPTYFHCTLGRDRTGLVRALYRVKVQGVPPAVAYKEWAQLGFTNKVLKAIDNFFRKATGFDGEANVAPAPHENEPGVDDSDAA